MRLNAEFATYARKHSHLLINDILYLSAQVGQAAWFRPSYWYNFHMALSPTASVALGHNVAAIVKSVYGKSKKCLVLDLDNTLWGGVIGDDGLQNLILGKDHPVGEAYLDFQRYVKDLQRRGVILAVCSKNDDENAKEGFSHPDSVLKFEDFSAFKANWNTKPENIREIAAELNIGLDSIVFVDDNPAERALVEEQLAGSRSAECRLGRFRFRGSSRTRALLRSGQDRSGRSQPLRLLQLKCGAKRLPIPVLQLWRLPGLARNERGDRTLSVQSIWSESRS